MPETEVLANEQRFLAVYINPKAKPQSQLTFIEPVFETVGPALIALQSYRLEGCTGIIFCGIVNTLIEFIDQIEAADPGGEIAKKGFDFLKGLAKEKGLEVYYEQTGGESPTNAQEVTAALKMPGNLTLEGKPIWKQLIKNKEWEIRKLLPDQKQKYIEHLYQWACKTAGVSPYQVAPEENFLALYNQGFQGGENCVRDVISDMKSILKMPKGMLLKYHGCQEQEFKNICHFGAEFKIKEPNEKTNLDIHRKLINFHGFKMVSPHIYSRAINRCTHIQVECYDDSLGFNVFVELQKLDHKGHNQMGKSWAKTGKLSKKDLTG